jgi:ribulose-phosphate 3-epimerase
MNHLIAPSLLSADFLNLERDVEMVNRSEADWFHLDIMDGLFVPNISFGFPILAKIQEKAKKPLDVHLMIVDPDRYLKRFAEVGANFITVHYEACPHLHRTIQAIKNLGVKAGVVLNPHSPVHLLSSIIKDVDLVLLMSVNPGYGGQKFIPETYSKIEQLKELILEKGSEALIEIDGGVDLSNVAKIVGCGADVLVAGNTVFAAPNPEEAIHQLKVAI